MRTPPGPEAVAVLAERRVKQRLQHLQQGLLNQPIRHRRYAQLALASVRLRDRYPSYRTGPVRPPQQLVSYLRPSRDQMAGGLLNIQSIHARCAPVGFDAFPRLPQVLSRQRRLQQRRPCALGILSRAARFVAGRFAPGFTVRYPCPPRWLRASDALLARIDMALNTPPRSALRPVLAATTASADFSLRFFTVGLSATRRDLPR